MLRKRQSSDFSLLGTSASKSFIQDGPNSVASNIPFHAPIGLGLLNRRFPTGGLANGTRRYWRTVSSLPGTVVSTPLIGPSFVLVMTVLITFSM